MQPIRITALRTTTVAVPLEAALRHASGAHWGRFIRTIVEVDTDAGITGLGEMGGGGESAALAFEGLEPYLLGHDPFQVEALRWKIANPTASLYNNRTQLLAAIEFACLDIIGQALGVPVHALLGGALRDRVPFASYLFFRFAADASGRHEVRTPEQLVAHARALKAEHGFTSHKLKGGVFPPAHELRCYLALAEAFPAAVKDALFTFGMQVTAAALLWKNLEDINGQPKAFHRTLLDLASEPPTDLSLDLYFFWVAKNHDFKVETFDVDFGLREHGESKWAFNWRSKARNIARSVKYMSALKTSGRP